MRTLTAALLVSLSLAGCGGVHYVMQAADGQFSLLDRARPIPVVLRDEKTPPRLRALLKEIGPIKKFGEANGLKPTENYTGYVKLDGPAVVWVVTACEPLRFKPRVWQFPIVGAFPYLGWFHREDARSFAAEIRKEGLDVDVRGATAYSTLGWFRDALLSSMISDGDEALGELVNVVLHESVHATLHVQSEAYFNESVASFVADHLTVTWLEWMRGADSAEEVAYEKAEARGDLWRKRMHETYEELDRLYASSIPDAGKLQKKARILADLRHELGARREINNATLVQYRAYDSGQADFEALYRACNFSWPRFLGALRNLKPASFSRPQQEDLAPVLRPLVQQGCPAAPGT